MNCSCQNVIRFGKGGPTMELHRLPRVVRPRGRGAACRSDGPLQLNPRSGSVLMPPVPARPVQHGFAARYRLDRSGGGTGVLILVISPGSAALCWGGWTTRSHQQRGPNQSAMSNCALETASPSSCAGCGSDPAGLASAATGSRISGCRWRGSPISSADAGPAICPRPVAPTGSNCR